MESSEFIDALEEYAGNFRSVLARFRQTNTGLFMSSEDNAWVKQISIEVMDLIDERFGRNQYSQMIANAINEGRNNFHEMQSYRSIEEVISVIGSVITKVERNPEISSTKPEENIQVIVPLKYPETMTLRWVKDYVPLPIWSWFIGLLLLAFVAGINFGRSALYNMITQEISTTSPIDSNESKSKK